MILLRLIIALFIGTSLVIILFPDLRNKLYKVVEPFSGRHGSWVAYSPEQSISKKVSSEHAKRVSFSDMNDANTIMEFPQMMDKLHVEGNGFSNSMDHILYKVPDFHGEYKMLNMKAPRTSETYDEPRSDAFHIYYQSLHNTLDGHE